MKQIKLGGKYGSIIGNYALVDDADYEWLNQWRWYADKKHNRFYAARQIRIGEKQAVTYMHRAILRITESKIMGDHINGNGLDNQRDNIRICTHKQNQDNKSGLGGTSKYKGVCLEKRKNLWRAQLGCNGKQIYLGAFSNENDAAIAYNNAAIKYQGEFARLNIITV